MAMNRRVRLLAVSIAMLLAACAARVDRRQACEDKVGYLASLTGACDKDTALECEQVGGKLIARSMMTQACEFDATDAGKACSDSDECEGICIPPESAYEYIQREPPFPAGTPPVKMLASKVGAPMTGVCTAKRWEPKFINCEPHVAKGKLAMAGCYD